MNKYYDMIGKKVKVKDSDFTGTLVQVNDTQLTIVNDHGATLVVDMPQVPYVAKRNQASKRKNAVGEWEWDYESPELYEATKDMPKEEQKIFRMEPPFTPVIVFEFSPEGKVKRRGSLSPYSSKEEADKALLDFIENYYKPNKDQMSVEEIYNLYKQSDSYSSNKQAREEKRTEAIQKGMKEHRSYLAQGGTIKKNTSNYNGISYNNPISNAGWQIVWGQTRNGKPLMFDQISISGFDRLKYRKGWSDDQLKDFMFNEIKNPVEQNSNPRNVFEYADLISEKVNEVCQEQELDFSSNNLFFNLYRCPEKRLYSLCIKNRLPKDPRAFDELYWRGESKPLLINQITSDEYINSFDKNLLDVLYKKQSSVTREDIEGLDIYNQNA